MSIPVRAAPPRPVAKPGHVKVMKALFKYVAQQPDELSFEEGDLLYVVDQKETGWWTAKCGGRTGLVPENYVEESAETLLNPLHEAAKRGNIDFMSECLRNQVSVNGLDKAGSTPLYWASHAGHVDCVRNLLAVPTVAVNSQNKLGDTPLHAAAWKGHADIVKLLLDEGANTSITNKENKTALNLAHNADTATLLKQAIAPVRVYSGEYGEEEDSD
ncbi:PREDICTED: osteoclast-stimulating factor 1-like [Priapulus caudatus]|uniref:Osteoclast-stimulating factor 1 n=1 Tax=Priapulus caudatus TaxID=37621 RepID=A0ABM1EL59_PRICU|nr:PREDICTED: osteoclast-stimulating factor 1-like [Priapulus caudatus]XP_014672931.1 PREDICTED: osteoclast-stimulating factor 1-like [Priapulus caudatus]XP_014672933.1 PREDICTED: osteoclast-stimulating factor 1-like [Priapulus caudatus]